MPTTSERDEDNFPVTAANWEHLVARVSTLEGSLRILATSNVQLTQQMGEITVNQHRADAQREEQTMRLDAITENLAANTENLAANTKTTEEILIATRDLRDVVITAKTGGKFARWLAPTVIAMAAFFSVIGGWWDSAVKLFSK